MKLAPGADPVTVQEKIMRACRKLDDDAAWINHPSVMPRCPDIPSTYDLMVRFDLEDESQLQSYFDHPLTQKLADQLEGLVVDQASFSHY